MKKIFSIVVVLSLCFGVGYLFGWGVGKLVGKRQRVVVLSTNDIHASIDRIPQLATAVAACRDTVTTVLVDAGDRWTGNAFVDKAEEPYRPIIDLMNSLKYDVAVLGNHEFDLGAEYLNKMNQLFDFEIVCANVISEDTTRFAQPAPYTVIERDGMRLGFVGVITNYGNNNHPDGNDASFVGLRFPDPQQTACDYAEQVGKSCDVPIVLSHMGDDRDMELAQMTSAYPLIIGGHTHRLLDTLVGNVIVAQTGKSLKHIGVTTMTLRRGKLLDIEYRNVPLADYAPDSVYLEKVSQIKSAPALLAPVGKTPNRLDKVGLAAMVNGAIKRATKVDVAIYHYGGIRLDSLVAGSVSKADIYTMEPFSSQVYTMRMTPEEMEAMIVAKYNDVKNPKESHRIDLFASVPYTILTDEVDNAYAVEFPTLKRGKSYRVAMGDYIYKNYAEVSASHLKRDVVLLTDALIDFVASADVATISNRTLQKVRVVKK